MLLGVDNTFISGLAGVPEHEGDEEWGERHDGECGPIQQVGGESFVEFPEWSDVPFTGLTGESL